MADIAIFSNCSPADYKKNVVSLNLNFTEQEIVKNELRSCNNIQRVTFEK